MTRRDTRAGAQVRSATRVSQRRTWATSRCRTRAAPRQHLGSTWRSAQTTSQRRIGSTPPRIGHIPRPVSGLQRPSTVSGPPQEPRNKKSARIATFLRLGIVAWRQNAIRSPKTQQKRLFSGPEERRGVRNRKKVAKIPSFLFLQWVRSPQHGKSREKRVGYHGQQPKTTKRKAPAMRTPPKKPIWLESTLPWHRTARNKHRAQPSAYRRSLLRPVPHGCTEAR